MLNASRLHDVSRLLDVCNVDSIVITSRSSVFYMSGFLTPIYSRLASVVLTPSQRPLLLVPAVELPITNRLEWPGDVRGYAGDGAELVGGIVSALEGRKVRRVGVEFEFLPTTIADSIQTALQSVDFVDISDAMERVWYVKTPPEIQNIRRASQLCAIGFDAARNAIEMSQPELAAKSHGDLAVFDAAARRIPDCRVQVLSNVVSGFRTSAGGGHDLPTGRPPQKGEPVFYSWVVNCEGYWAMLGRTTYIGEPDRDIQGLRACLDDAKRAALKCVSPGAPVDTIYQSVIDVLKPWSQRLNLFISVGRGIGANMSEGPTIARTSDKRLVAGMVLRIGPEVFGSFGVGGGIDTVLVDQTGHDVLTRDPSGADLA